jgi:hypothetical protein
MRKVPHRSLLYCEDCEAQGTQAHLEISGKDGRAYRTRQLGPTDDTEKVSTYCARRLHRFYATKDSVVSTPDGDYTVGEIHERTGFIQIVQPPGAFDSLSLEGVLAIRGISPPSFPRDLSFVSNRSYNLFYELAHYSRLGECDVVGFAWWANKFKPDIARLSAERSWDRFKSMLRSVGVPITLERGKAFRFDDPAGFVDGVMAACNTETTERWT